jgi:hypothetical protein
LGDMFHLASKVGSPVGKSYFKRPVPERTLNIRPSATCGFTGRTNGSV